MTRDELIAALEQAKEGSAELDREMFAVLHDRPLGERETYIAYTRSIDAALAAIPTGWQDDISCEMGIGEWSKKAFAGRSKLCLWWLLNGDMNNPQTKQVEGRHDSPAIALCIAVVKARSSTG